MTEEKFTTSELIVVIIMLAIVGHMFCALVVMCIDCQMTESVYEEHYITNMEQSGQIYFDDDSVLKFYNVTIETGENLSTTWFNDLDVGFKYKLEIKEFIRHEEWDRKIINGMKTEYGD